jgi:hypothetical protein
MDTDPLHWLPGSFYRKPSWRWLRAEYLTATGRRLDPRIDDGWVAHARAALNDRGESVIAAVRAAREVWAGNPVVNAELQALLLTTEPLDRIAGRFHLSCRRLRDLDSRLTGRAVAVAPALAAVEVLLAGLLGTSSGAWVADRAGGHASPHPPSAPTVRPTDGAHTRDEPSVTEAVDVSGERPRQVLAKGRVVAGRTVTSRALREAA